MHVETKIGTGSLTCAGIIWYRPMDRCDGTSGNLWRGFTDDDEAVGVVWIRDLRGVLACLQGEHTAQAPIDLIAQFIRESTDR